MANKLELATLGAYIELKTLFETPISKRNEKRISELVTITNYLKNILAVQRKTTPDELDEYFMDLAHSNI